MTKIKKNNVAKKVIKQNQIEKRTENTNQTFGDKSPILLSLYLDRIVPGLRLDFCVEKRGDKNCFIMVVLNDKPLGLFEMYWSDEVLPEDGALIINADIIGDFIPN